MAQFIVDAFAPAKINLCLHVTGRRADGYHLLDSLVVFAGVGDRVALAEGAGLSLTIEGPEAANLAADPDNLVLRAARAIGVTDAALTLWKALPVASGIGGGSADAAATLRLLSRRTGRPLPPDAAVLALGADVPVCLSGRPVRMRGVGEDLTPLPPLPSLWVVLVNPRVPVPTPAVFAALAARTNPPLPDMPAEVLRSASSFANWLLAHTRNDLVAPAAQVTPVLAQVQTALAAAPGSIMARMSGSGGTHFGLCASQAGAVSAARAVQADHPGWWVACAPVLGGQAAAERDAQVLTLPQDGPTTL
jgi:4-diphosphocytidyl-2-C-methyl-D-erythritol kinase